MSVLIIFIVIALMLFMSSYITRRRFGLLGLALAAGATLSTIWGYNAGLLVGAFGILPNGPVTTAVTLSVIVMLPSVVLLFHGYTYKGFVGRVIGALMFTLLAMAFLVEPLGYALNLEGVGVEVYNLLREYKPLIISVGLIFAVIDLFFTKPVSLTQKRSRR